VNGFRKRGPLRAPKEPHTLVLQPQPLEHARGSALMRRPQALLSCAQSLPRRFTGPLGNLDGCGPPIALFLAGTPKPAGYEAMSGARLALLFQLLVLVDSEPRPRCLGSDSSTVDSALQLRTPSTMWRSLGAALSSSISSLGWRERAAGASDDEPMEGGESGAINEKAVFGARKATSLAPLLHASFGLDHYPSYLQVAAVPETKLFASLTFHGFCLLTLCRSAGTWLPSKSSRVGLKTSSLPCGHRRQW
jgi:hypothetical protein